MCCPFGQRGQIPFSLHENRHRPREITLHLRRAACGSSTPPVETAGLPPAAEAAQQPSLQPQELHAGNRGGKVREPIAGRHRGLPRPLDLQRAHAQVVRAVARRKPSSTILASSTRPGRTEANSGSNPLRSP